MSEKIKFVVPTLNTYLILPKLIKSIKDQSWKKWSLSFVDGQSTPEHHKWLINTCKQDSRLKVLKQEKKFKGIFGAMNQGIENIEENEWILFWGSDDWAASSDVLKTITDKVNSYSNKFDLVVCKGKYVDNKSRGFSRDSNFFNNKFANILNKRSFREKLFFGMTPPHQATLFSSRALKKLSVFSDRLMLASDLDYFLKFSQIKNISILVINIHLVNMSTSGISTQKNKLRLKEVFFSYKNSFGVFFITPLIMRYVRKIYLKLFSKI